MIRLRIVAGALTLLAGTTLATAQERAGVVTTLQGTATVARRALPQPLPLKFRDDVFLQDKLATGDQSIVRLLLGGKAVVTVRERSILTVTEVPGKSTITLDSGKIALAVQRERMRRGEQIDVQTPNAIAGVRGTVVIIEVFQASAQLGGGSGTTTTLVSNLRGTTEVRFADQNGQFTRTVTLGPGSFARATGTGLPASGQMTPQQQQTATQGLNAKAQAPASAASDAQNTAKDQAISTTVGTFGGGTTTTTTQSDQSSSSSSGEQKDESKPTEETKAASETSSDSSTTTQDQGTQSETTQADITPTQNTDTTTTGPANNDGFEKGTFEGWSKSGAGSVIGSFSGATHSFAPPEGSHQAIIHTGSGADNNTTSTLSRTFNATTSVLKVRFTYRFMSNEYPNQATTFNDTFKATLTDSANAATQLAFESRNSSAFTAAPENMSGGGFTLSSGNGYTDEVSLDTTVPVALGDATLKFEVKDVGDSGVDSAALVDGTLLQSDPPKYLLLNGDTLVRTTREPLYRLIGGSDAFDSLMVIGAGGSATIAGPLLEATDASLDVPFSILSAVQGGTLTSTSYDPLVRLDGGTYRLATQDAIVDISGTTLAPDPDTGLPIGTDRPVQHPAAFVEVSRATLTTRKALKVDTALLEATAPLLNALAGASVTTTEHAIDASYRARVTSMGPVVALNASSLTVNNGALVNLGGASVLRVTGDLIRLADGSTLRLLNGPVVSVTGGSFFSLTGALVGFSGAGNLVSVSNSLCSFGCTTIGGLPIAFTNGATATNVSVAGSAIKGVGTFSVAPGAAALLVSGASSKVTIGGQ